MSHEGRLLAGEVALVVGGGEGLGRAVAVALGARGVRTVVTGRDERALGTVVGEIACGGGAARHLVGDPADPAHLEAALRRSTEAFGKPSFVVARAQDALDARATLVPLFCGAIGPRGRLLLLADAAADAAVEVSVGQLVSDLARDLLEHAATCNALLFHGGPDGELERAAGWAIAVCFAAEEAVTGRSFHAGAVRADA